VVAEVTSFADEILIGVDATSPDRTYEVACGLADVVYRFRLPGQLSPARMLVFEYATGDWILSLDDDESMEESFDAILPTLLSDGSITHCWFPRKWIVNLDPCEYLHAIPWYPNFSLRLFRNDRSLVWKPPDLHGQYYVQGSGYLEERTSILHFELVQNTPGTRARKLEMYRQATGPSAIEYYAPPKDTPRRPAAPRQITAARAPRSAPIVHPDIHELAPIGLPPWNATFLNIDVPRLARRREPMIAEVTVLNSGRLAWSRTNSTNNGWPVLKLGRRLLDRNGRRLNKRFNLLDVPRLVRPGEKVTFIWPIRAPRWPGRYIIEWDMLSESECWFEECGSAVERTHLTVTW
jgi:hypothetical protein